MPAPLVYVGIVNFILSQSLVLVKTVLDKNTMSKKDRQKWDARYRSNIGETDASSLVKRYWHLAPIGKALDIACGNGRNSLFLAGKGFSVDAVDISAVAIHHLAGETPDNLNVVRADLDTWTMPENRYDLVLSIRFLDRRLFPMIQSGLKPEGCSDLRVLP
jgi:tellurite methyltransferase